MVAAAYMPQVKGFPETVVEQALDDALGSSTAVPVLAISGLQGSGKSTLAAQVAARAQTRGLNAATLSIDDVYLTRAQRQRLARQVHPLLITRGPPGTHDLPLAHAVLD
ncbi:kinase, partial [Stenotrophomonas sp. HMWF022]